MRAQPCYRPALHVFWNFEVVSLYRGMGLLDADTRTILFKQPVQFTAPVVQCLF